MVSSGGIPHRFHRPSLAAAMTCDDSCPQCPTFRTRGCEESQHKPDAGSHPRRRVMKLPKLCSLRRTRNERSGARIRAQLCLESLDDRMLLAASVSVVQGNLVIQGSSGSDRAVVSDDHSGGTDCYKVELNGHNSFFNRSLVTGKIKFDGGAGNDYFRNATSCVSEATGRSGKDSLIGGAGHDELFGDDGNDSLEGGGGDDYLYGGAGNDVMHGGDGGDSLLGSYGNDVLYGDSGNDHLFGEENNIFGPNEIYGGNDSLYGGLGDDVLLGEGGNDVEHGGAGNDYLADWFGKDQLFGDVGDDALSTRINGVADTGNDLLDGGQGNDSLTAGAGNDILLGGSGKDSLIGGAGNDRLDGGYDGQADYLEGGAGQDTFVIHRVH